MSLEVIIIWGFLIPILLVILFARFLSCVSYPCFKIFCLKHKIDTNPKELAIMWYGGLIRGIFLISFHIYLSTIILKNKYSLYYFKKRSNSLCTLL